MLDVSKLMTALKPLEVSRARHTIREASNKAVLWQWKANFE